MTKTKIDYSKSCIYKIVCKNPEIMDCYVGSTTNLIKRRYQHKSCCNNINNKHHNLYVYEFIRSNGGFENWDFIQIQKFNCDNKEELHRRERYYIETLMSTLNKIRPTRTQREYQQDNRELFNKIRKKYYKQHKEIISEKAKNYREKNREIISEKAKNYREQNREIISEKAKEKMTCECGIIYNKSNKSHHYKTHKHQNYLNNLN
jgi:hypothetical protein